MSGKISFWMPSGKNTTNPTARRIRIVHGLALLSAQRDRIVIGDFILFSLWLRPTLRQLGHPARQR
jgi:hypothetical protein